MAILYYFVCVYSIWDFLGWLFGEQRLRKTFSCFRMIDKHINTQTIFIIVRLNE